MPDSPLSLIQEGLPEPCPTPFNMADYVMRAGRRTPEKIALTVLEGRASVAETWRYSALERAILGVAGALTARGLQRGDRVALRLGNVSAFPILFFGTIAAGGIAVPTSAQLTEAEFHRLAGDMRPRFAAIADDLALDRVPAGVTTLPQSDWPGVMAHPQGDYVQIGPDDPAVLIYTSGTSGRPKGVLHAHRAAWARRMMWRDWYGLGSTDVMLHAGAFNWTYTLGTGLTDPWAAGAASLIHSAPADADIWPEAARAHGATLFAAVPGLYRRLLRSVRDLAADFDMLRHGLTAGERLAEPLLSGWQERTGKPLYEALGMSEISTFISSGPGVPTRPGRAGRPQRGRRVAVLAGDTPVPRGTPGDLAVSTSDPGFMLGYFGRPEETQATLRGDWFITEDRAEMDAEGYIAHLGRSDDVMTAQGYRVSPQEVEEAIAAHPAVAEVAVCEIRPRDDLTLIAAFIVPNGVWPGENTLDAHARQSLAAYKCPRLWQRVEALPRTQNGKLQRRRLVELLGPTGA
ncbi:MAG: AMP-binding protein [Pseudomonadota bacterium]